MANKQHLRKFIAIAGNAGVLKAALVVLLIAGLWFSYDWYREKSAKFDNFVTLRETLVHDHVVHIYVSACRANADHVLRQSRPHSTIKTLPEYKEYCELESDIWAKTQASASSRELSFVQYLMGNELAIPRNIDEIKEIARHNAATIF